MDQQIETERLKICSYTHPLHRLCQIKIRFLEVASLILEHIPHQIRSFFVLVHHHYTSSFLLSISLHITYWFSCPRVIEDLIQTLLYLHPTSYASPPNSEDIFTGDHLPKEVILLHPCPLSKIPASVERRPRGFMQQGKGQRWCFNLKHFLFFAPHMTTS